MSECEKYLEMISAQIDNELSPEEEWELERHLEGCPSCRRVKEAFGAISGAVSEELVQPPEELAASVMQKIRESDKCGEDRKEKSRNSKRIYLKRYLALAACAALIIITASSQIPNVYRLARKSAEPQAADTFMANADAPASTEGADEVEAQSLDGDDEDVYIRSTEGGEGGEGGAAAPVPEPEEAPAEKADVPEASDSVQASEGQITANFGLAGSGQSMGDTLSSIFSAWTVSLWDDGASAPFFTFAGTESSLALLDLLGTALDGDAGEIPGEVPAVVISLSDGTQNCRLSVWSGGGDILCLYSIDGGEEVLFKTDGSAEDFGSYIDTLRNLAA